MNDKDNQQWLNALAGRADTNADPATTAQAQTLRDAMLARREAIEHATQNADSAQFDKLYARLQREGLLNATSTAASTTSKSNTWVGALWHKMASTITGSGSLPLWGLAATLVLGIGVVVQMGLLDNNGANEADVLRGGPATVLMVANPETRLAELVAGLDLAKARYTVARKDNGEIQITVQADDAAMVYLQSQRLTPTVREGVVVIVLRTQQSGGAGQQ